MRLGTCIALELVVAAGAVAGVWVGVSQASRLAGNYLMSSEAVAATSSPSPPRIPEVPVRLPRATLEISRPVVTPNNVFGAHDDVLLAPLGAAPLTRIKLNHGGTSLSLRVDFANGSRASFKPEQIHPQSDPRREIAAYRVDRLLGFGRVPPAKATTFTLDEMIAAADPSRRTYIGERLRDEGLIRRGGLVHGELSWWVPEIKLAKLGAQPIDDKAGKLLWTSYLQVGATIPAEVRPLVEQISALVLFDVLIDNPDRWSGANTVMSPDGQILFFMDNSMSFSKFAFGHHSNLLALRRIQVFPRKLVARLRELTLQMLTDSVAVPGLADHGLAPLIDDEEIRAILARRDNMMRYIDQLIEEHGEDTVLAFP
ncbi:MAG: hypothetical protein JWP01_2023 [Myxococcales bacterium]|nr:hypothetical protein [Myxococcales bacterium]